jgi:hypothetical protein
MTTITSPFELDIESDIEPGAFARIVATLVNGSPVYLAKVIVGGTVVYPTTHGSLFELVTVRTCEFRTRDANTTLSAADLRAVTERISPRFAWTRMRAIEPSPLIERVAS